MAPKKATQPAPDAAAPPKAAEKIIPVSIEKEMHTSYLDYAMSVIIGRALPDVRDGLKPVHRRALFAMYELGNTHDKPYKKSARIVGEILGKYHPHGDTAAYDTIVRMAQDFSLRYPLVDGQGNFGSVDGDSPAAMRYTEVRMQKLAEEMVGDLGKETVDYTPNFDGSLQEPTLLPTTFPNLLVNGSSGIAVGMATNIAPHNMSEVIDGLTALIDNPSVGDDILIQLIKGPDFPTGGIILGRRGIHEAFATGRGSVRVRGRAEIQDKGERRRIIITELPYQVNKATLIEQIALLVQEKKITGISDLRDGSDRDGMNIVIELKRDANAEVVLNQLYSMTPLESSFGIINLALVKGKPIVHTLRGLLMEFLNFRREIVTKRCRFDLNKSEDRAHILEGLKICQQNIDEVVKTIRAAPDPNEARGQLMRKLKLSEKQALAILEMKLSRLTQLERGKIDAEYKELLVTIAWLKKVLGDPKEIDALIRKELEEIKKNYGDKRRTEIVDFEGEIEVEDLIKRETVVVTITNSDYIKRIPVTEYKSQHRGGKGVVGLDMKEEDLVKDVMVCSTHAYLLFFTDQGNVHWLKTYQIPSAGRYAMGKPIINLLGLDQNEKIAAWVPVEEFLEEESLIMCTKKGIIKRTNLSEYSRPRKGGIIAITLKEKDALIEVRRIKKDQEIILVSKAGYAIRFSEADVREIGRSGQGVIGMRLREDEKDEIVAMALNDKPTVLTITENGFGKRTELEEYRLQSRGGMGVINIQTTDRNGEVVASRAVSDSDDILLISSKGQMIRVPAKDISVIGRNTQGVRVMRLDAKEKVVSVARIIPEEEADQAVDAQEKELEHEHPGQKSGSSSASITSSSTGDQKPPGHDVPQIEFKSSHTVVFPAKKEDDKGKKKKQENEDDGLDYVGSDR
ncbi:DNA gyrase subunit A [Candidatus Gugararchaeum adminiculabundum]|nr:DNA gyrase subunit A [Candidatus Gugararchaeum adminiculabundum]